MVGSFFNHIFLNLENNPLSSIASGDTDWRSKGVWRKFDQSVFLETSVFEVDGLQQYGYIYYPTRCFDGSISNCKVHMSLHGCGNDINALSDYAPITDLGYTHYAASNDIIVIFPQARFSWANSTTCFDFFGYTNLDYLTGKDTYMTNKAP